MDALRKYVDATEQLVTEILVADISRSVTFYRRLGFELSRDAGDFVELSWEGHLLFLAELSAFGDASGLSAFGDASGAALPGRPAFPPANVRVMVPDVDRHWRLANELSAEIAVPIDDREYGLRDFTIRDPDGFGIRFASLLQGGAAG